MSAAMSQMSQGMGDICPIVRWDQWVTTELASVGDSSCCAEACLRRAYSDSDEALNGVAGASGPYFSPLTR